MNKLTGILIAVVVLILLIMIPVGMYFNFYNSVIVMKNDAEAQLKQVDNQLQRRHDLIPNLVNTVKGYAKHETEIFTNIANARSRLAQAGSLQEKAAANSQLEGA
ncbi:MAG TPA: LemA family protein, partial [Bacillota bacterium]|nr:LemA family protein [Bacillota bacterium]